MDVRWLAMNKINLRKFKKDTLTSALISIFRLVILVSIGYLVLYPVIYMLSFAFRDYIDYIDPAIYWIPKNLSLEHLQNAERVIGFVSSTINSVVFEVLSAFIEVVTCSIVAYGMARFKFRGKGILTVMLFMMIIVPEQMTIIPKMVNYSNLDFLGIIGLINKIFGSDFRISILDTGFAFWLPSLFAVGLKAGMIIFIFMQFYKGLPKELEEAAWIDGATLSQTYLKIALPSSSVVITTVVILSLIWHWNDYYLAAMYTSSDFPLAVQIARLPTNLTTINIWNGPYFIGAKSAACLVFIVPLLIVYMFLQRKFVQSIDRVGITG